MIPDVRYELTEMAYLAYEEPGHIESAMSSMGFRNFRFFDNAGSQAFAAMRMGAVYVAFRGTQASFSNLKEMYRDFKADLKLKKSPWIVGNVHRGFLNYYRRVSDDVFRYIYEAADVESIYTSGHSLGGAEATLFAVEARMSMLPVKSLVTLGCPRVGDRCFSNWAVQHVPGIYRYVNNNDIVARVPKIGYVDVGDMTYINSRGKVEGHPGAVSVLLDRAWGYYLAHRRGEVDSFGDHDKEKYRRFILRELRS